MSQILRGIKGDFATLPGANVMQLTFPASDWGIVALAPRFDGAAIGDIGLVRALLVLLVLALAGPALAAPGERHALIIGNSAYSHVPSLGNPGNDASDLAARLEGLGYIVDLRRDLSRVELNAALRDFRRKSLGADHALIYFAGHGIEIDRSNYLIPTDAALKSDIDVEFEAVSLDRVVLAASGATKLSLVILDACRDNPFLKSMTRSAATRSIGRGLAKVEPTGNTLVAFAAKEGTVASDGDGRNSPYAAALMETLGTPGIEINRVFRLVRDKVIASTGGQQEPFVYGSLSAEEIYLAPPVKQPDRPATAPAASQDVAPVSPSLDLAFWNAIKDSRDPRDFEDYLRQFPSGTFRGLAERRSTQLAALSDPAPKSEDAPLAEDDVFWAGISGSADAGDFDAFLKRFPESRHRAAAEARLSQLRAEAALAAATGTGRALIKVQPGGEETTEEVPLEDPPAEEDVAALSSPQNLDQTTSDQSDGFPYRPSTAEVREAQERLNVLGFSAGRADGLIGPRTRRAIAGYQRSVGIEDTGELTLATYKRLWSDVSAEAIENAQRKAEADAAAKAAADAERRAERQRAAAAAAASQPTTQRTQPTAPAQPAQPVQRAPVTTKVTPMVAYCAGGGQQNGIDSSKIRCVKPGPISGPVRSRQVRLTFYTLGSGGPSVNTTGFARQRSSDKFVWQNTSYDIKNSTITATVRGGGTTVYTKTRMNVAPFR